MLCLVPKQEEIIPSLGDKVKKDGKAAVITIQHLCVSQNGVVPRPALKSPRFIAAVRAQRLSLRQRHSAMAFRSGSINDSTPRQMTNYSPHPARNLNPGCRRAMSATVSRSSPSSLNVNTLSQQCCDVLGPPLCYDCVKNIHKDQDTFRQNSSCAENHPEKDDCATRVVVQHFIPSEEVNDHMSTGDISSSSFKQWLGDMQIRAKEANEQARIAMKYRKNPLSIFRHVGKINEIEGQVTKKKIFLGVPKESVLSKSSEDTFSEQIRPMFISPRKVVHQKSRFSAYFDPPLLPKICQNVEPTFFAGSDTTYKLPERLPDDRIPEETY